MAIDRSRLIAGQTLVATQEIDGQSHKPPDSGTPVEAAVKEPVVFGPPKDGPVIIHGEPHECGRSVLLSNCLPGATLKLTQGLAVLGTGTALDRLAVINFLPGQQILTGTPLKASQTICTDPNPVDTLSGAPIRPPIGLLDGRLPKPMIGPVMACQRLITIRNVVPGAIVRLFRRGTVIFEGPSPTDVHKVLVDALQEDETLTVEQEMPQCHIGMSEQDRRDVEATELKPPYIGGPLCAGPGLVTVSRVVAGATVRIFANGVELGRWEAPVGEGSGSPADDGSRSLTTCEFPVTIPVTTPPATITAQQELCGVVSALSRDYTAASGMSGRWYVVEDNEGKDLLAEEFAIHAALVRTGDILFFSGDQHHRDQTLKENLRADPNLINHTALFDCQTLKVQKIGSPSFDTFCVGHALLADGRLLIAGGTEMFLEDLPLKPGEKRPFHGHDLAPFPGLAEAALFTPGSSSPWSNAGPMPGGGRWYPTLVTLATGEVLVLSGHPEEADRSRHNNNTMLSYRPSVASKWFNMANSAEILSEGPGYLYPRLHVLPGGNVFSSTPVKIGQSARWTPGSGNTWWNVDWAPAGYDGFRRTAVLLPLMQDENYCARVAIFGGPDQGYIIDFGTVDFPNTTPVWKTLGFRSSVAGNRLREHGNSVILPTGEIFVCGGVEDKVREDGKDHGPRPYGGACQIHESNCSFGARSVRECHALVQRRA